MTRAGRCLLAAAALGRLPAGADEIVLHERRPHQRHRRQADTAGGGDRDEPGAGDDPRVAHRQDRLRRSRVSRSGDSARQRCSPATPAAGPRSPAGPRTSASPRRPARPGSRVLDGRPAQRRGAPGVGARPVPGRLDGLGRGVPGPRLRPGRRPLDQPCRARSPAAPAGPGRRGTGRACSRGTASARGRGPRARGRGTRSCRGERHGRPDGDVWGGYGYPYGTERLRKRRRRGEHVEHHGTGGSASGGAAKPPARRWRRPTHANRRRWRGQRTGGPPRPSGGRGAHTDRRRRLDGAVRPSSPGVVPRR